MEKSLSKNWRLSGCRTVWEPERTSNVPHSPRGTSKKSSMRPLSALLPALTIRWIGLVQAAGVTGFCTHCRTGGLPLNYWGVPLAGVNPVRPKWWFKNLFLSNRLSKKRIQRNLAGQFGEGFSALAALLEQNTFFFSFPVWFGSQYTQLQWKSGKRFRRGKMYGERAALITVSKRALSSFHFVIHKINK